MRDYFGEKVVLDLIEAPLVGDDRVAVRRSGPTTDDVLEALRVYVRAGDVMANVEVWNAETTLPPRWWTSLVSTRL
jgi:hypothetical protein